MGSKPSRSRVTVLTPSEVEGLDKVVEPPAVERTVSAPPTPQHPLGAPRSPEEEDFPSTAPQEDDSFVDGLGLSLSLTEGQSAQTHSGAWLSLSGSGNPDASLSVTFPGCVAEEAGAAGPSSPAARSGLAASRSKAGGGGDLRFDAPMEEVFALAVEAFGQSAENLSSSKWKTRVDALKQVGAILKGLTIKGPAAAMPSKGLQLRDHSRCFHAACLILNVVLRDKVLNVLIVAHELYRTVFEHTRAAVSEDLARFAMDHLIQHVLAKLGELNIALDDSARSCLVFSAGCSCFGLGATFDRLRRLLEESSARGPQRMRIFKSALKVVAHLQRDFAGRRAGQDAAGSGASWSPEDVACFVSIGVQVDAVTGARVQQEAASLAVTVFAQLGKASLDSLVAGLPQAAQEFVLRRVEEEMGDLGEDGDDEEGGVEMPDMDCLCVTGIALKAPTRRTQPVTEEGEEYLMDEILEEAGMVMTGQGIQAPNKSPVVNPLDEELNALGLSEELLA